MDDSISKIEIFFACMGLFFTILLVLFYNYMRVLIKKEKAEAQKNTAVGPVGHE